MKQVVITGASSGIGLATVEASLKTGYKVIATARKTEDLARLQQLGAEAVMLELSDEQSVNAAANTILRLTGGRIDALFNNAGYGLQVAMEDSTWQSLVEQHVTNVVGPIQLTNQLLPAMPKGSKLVFNSSILGMITIAFRGPYCMSKHALEAAADAYRLELENLGIAVHVIQPGPIEAQFRARTLATLKQTLGVKSPRLNYQNHLKRLNNPGTTPGTLPASAVAEVFIGIVEGKLRNSRTLVTRTAKTAAFFKRLLGHGFHKVARKAEPVNE